MLTQTLGTSSLTVSRLAYGCMRTVGTWNVAEVTPEREEQAKRAIRAAVDAGYTLFDHADIYCHGECERVFGELLAQTPGLRERMIIATKCGIRFPGDPSPDSPHRFDFSAEHILRSADLSLKRLRTDRIDLYQLHRPDLLMNPPEIAAAFEKLHTAGKVRFFGVSNFSPSFVRALQKHLPMPLIVNQVEIHLGRLDCFTDGTLDQCIENTMTPLSWSPLGGGMLGDGGKVRDNHPRRELMTQLIDLLDKIAAKYGVSRTVLSLAWLLKHPSRIIPIVGSAKPPHIEDAVKADGIDIDREDWYRLLVAARGERLP
ncbi:MAG: aldo/keto reductase [Burkholderiales bacterium]|nr:aldo/keto reductase [Phycisphaerae bacterium]